MAQSGCLLALLAVAAAAGKPNLIVILTDDLGWNTVYNNQDIISPNINALAADGVKLTSHYVYRYCSPTRAALLTGRSPLALANVRENFIPITLPQGTDIGFTMLPERLASAGYVSQYVANTRSPPVVPPPSQQDPPSQPSQGAAREAVSH